MFSTVSKKAVNFCSLFQKNITLEHSVKCQKSTVGFGNVPRRQILSGKSCNVIGSPTTCRSFPSSVSRLPLPFTACVFYGFGGTFFFGDAEIIKERNVYFEPFCWISYTMVRRILCYKSANQPRGHRDEFYLFFFFSFSGRSSWDTQSSVTPILLTYCLVS